MQARETMCIERGLPLPKWARRSVLNTMRRRAIGRWDGCNDPRRIEAARDLVQRIAAFEAVGQQMLADLRIAYNQAAVMEADMNAEREARNAKRRAKRAADKAAQDT